MAIIYRIKNKITKDEYIGKTIKTIEERFQRHIYSSNYGSKTHLSRAIRKYGTENFECSIIEETTNDCLNEREKFFIEHYNPKYNMTKGGDGGSLTYLSEEYRQKLSKKFSGKGNPMYGKFGKDNPNFGQKRGKLPKISKALSNPCVCDGMFFSSITEAEKHFKGKHSVRKRLDNPKYSTWYRLVPKTKRK